MPDSAVARPTLRADQAERTRRRIVDAVVAVVGERGDVEFTMPEIAAASGVSLRTLYRYYPTRQDLVDAVAGVADRVVATNLPQAEFSLDDLAPWLEEAWGELLAHEAFIRAQHTSPNGAAIRRARIPFFRDVTRELLLREIPGLDPDRAEDTVDSILVLVSSAAMLEYLDVLGLPVERAARLAADAVRALVDAARQDAGS